MRRTSKRNEDVRRRGDPVGIIRKILSEGSREKCCSLKQCAVNEQLLVHRSLFTVPGCGWEFGIKTETENSEQRTENWNAGAAECPRIAHCQLDQ
jgi:hypothetical protein